MAKKTKVAKRSKKAKTVAPSVSREQSKTKLTPRVGPDGEIIERRNGGARPGAGRKPGSLGKGAHISSLKNEVLHFRQKYGRIPLDHMLRVLNTDCTPQGENEEPEAYRRRLRHIEDRQDWAAQAAAPFMHAKLASIEIVAGGAPVQQEVDLTKLDNNELDQLERLVNKAAKHPELAPPIDLDESQYHEVESDT